MKRWANSPWMLPFTFVVVVLAMLVTPLFLIWHILRSKNVSFIEGDLVVGKEPVGIAQVEAVLIHAYFPVPTFAITVRNRRPFSVIPANTEDLYSWIKMNGVRVHIDGPRKKEFESLLGLSSSSTS
jgi:hypothetical protein